MGKKNAKNGTVQNSDGASARTRYCSPSLRSTSNRNTSIASRPGHHRVPLLATGSILTISGSGTAYKIGNRSITESASISLTATIVKSSTGRGMLDFTGGTLTIGPDTYTVVGGHGMISYHSDKMLLHLVVKNSAGSTFHLNLFGVHAKASSTTAFTVDFRMPQSKLDHLWFLKFSSATVTPK